MKSMARDRLDRLTLSLLIDRVCRVRPERARAVVIFELFHQFFGLTGLPFHLPTRLQAC
jgi:hypothetical protein